MSQSFAQASATPLVRQMVANLTSSLGHHARENEANQINLLPILTSTVIDELFRSFGFSSNTRPHLIKQGLFPKGIALRSRAMSTSIYPTLAVDLIALLACSNTETEPKQTKENQQLALSLKEEIDELTRIDLFLEVLASLAQRLPVGQPFTLAAITRLFRPALPKTLKPGEFPSLGRFDNLDYVSWEKWFKLAQFQQEFRKSFFETESGLFGGGNKLKPVANIVLGVIDGKDHSSPNSTSAVLGYSANEGQLAFQEEVELPDQLLKRLGCDWIDAPIARVEATRDAYYSRLVFYLPGLHNPATLQKLDRTIDFLTKNTTSPFGTIEGFERPWDEHTFDEIIAELEQTEGQVSN